MVPAHKQFTAWWEKSGSTFYLVLVGQERCFRRSSPGNLEDTVMMDDICLFPNKYEGPITSSWCITSSSTSEHSSKLKVMSMARWERMMTADPIKQIKLCPEGSRKPPKGYTCRGGHAICFRKPHLASAGKGIGEWRQEKKQDEKLGGTLLGLQCGQMEGCEQLQESLKKESLQDLVTPWRWGRRKNSG